MKDLKITAAGPLTIDVGKAETVHVHNAGPTTIITNARRVEDLEWAMSKLDAMLTQTNAENSSLRDRLAKTDGVLMELCQLLGLDPTGDVVGELKARMAVKAREDGRKRQLYDAVRAGLLTPGDALILLDRIGQRALFLGDRFDAAWIRFRADLRHCDAGRQVGPEVVATLEPSNPVRRWIEVHPCIPVVERFNRELSIAPAGFTLHTLSEPDEVWALWA